MKDLWLAVMFSLFLTGVLYLGFIVGSGFTITLHEVLGLVCIAVLFSLSIKMAIQKRGLFTLKDLPRGRIYRICRSLKISDAETLLFLRDEKGNRFDVYIADQKLLYAFRETRAVDIEIGLGGLITFRGPVEV